MLLLLICSIILIIVLGFAIFKIIKYKELITTKFQEYIEQEKEKINEQISTKQTELHQVELAIKEQNDKLIDKKLSVNETITQLNLRKDEAIKSQSEIIDGILKNHYTNEKNAYDKSLQQSLDILRKNAQETLENEFQAIQETTADAREALAALMAEVEDWQKRRDTINQDILRTRAVNEQQDFYRIILSPEDRNDIQVFNSIRGQLHKHEALDKLIYDGYIAKPVLEMVKRVLHGASPCGIYKITRISTGEIYIGKSTDVRARFQQHAKSCFNVGDIAHSILHITMQKDGIENFTFELLEECPKDLLSAREKFYIDLYGSKNYGLNEKAGG